MTGGSPGDGRAGEVQGLVDEKLGAVVGAVGEVFCEPRKGGGNFLAQASAAVVPG